jgi:hypothetical protein
MSLPEKHITAGIRLIDDEQPAATSPGSNPGTPADTPDKQPPLRGYSGVLAALFALLVVGAIVVALSGQARHQVALSLVRQPERYTELYFSGNGPTEGSPSYSVVGRAAARPGSLPGRVVVNVPFTVANHEGRATRFPYAVRVVDDAEALLGQAEGALDPADGQSLTTTVAVDIPATGQRAAVDVDLEGRGEHIRFLLAR